MLHVVTAKAESEHFRSYFKNIVHCNNVKTDRNVSFVGKEQNVDDSRASALNN